MQHEGIDHTFLSPQIAGKRVSLFYTGHNKEPELYVDGTIIAAGNQPDLTAITYDLNISVDHPYKDPNERDTTYLDQNSVFSLTNGSSYNIVCYFGAISNDLISARNTILTKNFGKDNDYGHT